jgi:hypothetical protein
MSLKEFINVLYFNIFRFHCYLQSLTARPIYGFIKMIGLDRVMTRRHGTVDWDEYLIDEVLNDQKGGISLFLTERFIGVMEGAILLTFWNLVCSFLRLDFYYWRYGVIFITVIGVVINFVIDPFSNDFRKFKSWSPGKARKFAIVTLLVITGIFIVCACSFAVYMSIAISNSK